MAKKALIVWGGWEGHEPDKVALIIEEALKKNGVEVEVSTSLQTFSDAQKLAGFDLIVPIWTMNSESGTDLQPLCDAVRNGAGIAGCHGGMCDAFRLDTEYQFMTGGQWVAHPGDDGTEYTVHVTEPNHYITRGIPDFGVRSEQYYLHIDPAIKVLATTHFPVADGPHVPNGDVEMPVVWTKYYGKGRVFYCSLGHQADTIASGPALEIMTRGLLWAAGCAG